MSAAQQVPFDIPMQDPTVTTVPEEAIRERAYELYERRGCDEASKTGWISQTGCKLNRNCVQRSVHGKNLASQPNCRNSFQVRQC